MTDTNDPMNQTQSVGPAVELRNVYKRFGTHQVLRGVDLTVPRGENLVVMGLSGSGKSVSLKIISGLLPPDSGEVEVDGQMLAGYSRKELARARSRLGFLFQNGGLINWMTSLENLALPLLEGGMSRRDADERAREQLASVGLAEVGDRFPSELSGGMRKRVGFARAVITGPRIMLYDEPTTGLDPITKRTIDNLIIRARDELGATGIVVSHDVRSTLRIADRIALLYEGKIDLVITPDEFLHNEHPVVRRFRRGETNVNPLAAVKETQI